MNKDKSSISRKIYFDTTIHLESVKDCISGKNEQQVIIVLTDIGFELNKDFVRQYPIGERFVIDIAFVNEQVAVEIDGESHKNKKQKRIDNIMKTQVEINIK